MVIEVIGLEVLDGYRLRVAFNDGLIGVVDLESHLWGEMFEPLREMTLFREAYVDRQLGTVSWPNGADFAPEFLHGEAAASRAIAH